MHKTMTQHFNKVQEITNTLYDIPEIILDTDIQENDILFDYIVNIVDNVYMPMVCDKCLTYSDVLDLYETYARLEVSSRLYNQIKMIGVNHYLIEKLNKIKQYSIENEIYEVINNLNHFNTISKQIKRLDIL